VLCVVKYYLLPRVLGRKNYTDAKLELNSEKIEQIKTWTTLAELRLSPNVGTVGYVSIGLLALNQEIKVIKWPVVLEFFKITISC
jgi:hypothetical protein